MQFYLGTHKPQWLGTASVPLFVSNRVLHERKTFPRALTKWALDSGGFSELSMFGEWRTKPKTYVKLVRRYSEEIGSLEWAAIQDWMCEPHMLKATGRSLESHQSRTITSYLYLNHIAPDLPWAPVVQGWVLDDYMRHIEQYDRAGIDLTQLPIVGVGSVCRRQNTDEAGEIFREIAATGIKIHGFGVKKTGLAKYAPELRSADSMAWSYRARFAEPLPGHTHKACNNCIDFAMQWRTELLEILEEQGSIT